MNHSKDCNGEHTTCIACDNDELNICCNEFGAPEYCPLHTEDSL